MGNLIIGFVLTTIGFVIFRMAHEPIEKRPVAFDLGFLTTLMYSGLILGGLYLCFKVQWYFPIIVFLTAPLIAEIIQKLIWHDGETGEIREQRRRRDEFFEKH